MKVKIPRREIYGFDRDTVYNYYGNAKDTVAPSNVIDYFDPEEDDAE